ncbi:MAG: hypothetical protein ACFE96_19170 [Candidatus Hermodarchaeota archaeon]
MFELPSSIVCPICKREIRLGRDGKGILTTDDIVTMRIKTPIFVYTGKTAEISLDMSVCNQCNTIIGITRKAM